MIPASAKIASARILVGFGQLVLLRTLTHVLVPVEMGGYYLALAFAGVVAIVFLNPVTTYACKQVGGWSSRSALAPAIRSIVLYTIFVGLLVAALTSLFAGNRILETGYISISSALTIGLYVSATAASALSIELCNVLGMRSRFAILTILEVWGKSGAIIIAISLGHETALGVILGMALWSALIGGVALASLTRHPPVGTQAPEDKDFRISKREVYAFCWPISVAAGLYWCQSQGFRIPLEKRCGLDILGKFSVGFGIGSSLMAVVENLVGQIHSPSLFGKVFKTKESQAMAWSEYARCVVLAIVPIGLYLTCATPYIGRWLLDAKYHEIAIYGGFGVVAQMLRGLSVVVYNGILLEGNTRAVIVPHAVGGGFLMLGVWCFASYNPMVSTGLLIIAAGLITIIGLAIRLHAQLHVRIPARDVVNAAIWVSPICVLLVIGSALNWHAQRQANVIMLAISGIALAALQYRIAKSTWLRQ